MKKLEQLEVIESDNVDCEKEYLKSIVMLFTSIYREFKEEAIDSVMLAKACRSVVEAADLVAEKDEVFRNTWNGPSMVDLKPHAVKTRPRKKEFYGTPKGDKPLLFRLDGVMSVNINVFVELYNRTMDSIKSKPFIEHRALEIKDLENFKKICEEYDIPDSSALNIIRSYIKHRGIRSMEYIRVCDIIKKLSSYIYNDNEISLDALIKKNRRWSN